MLTIHKGLMLFVHQRALQYNGNQSVHYNDNQSSVISRVPTWVLKCFGMSCHFKKVYSRHRKP